MNVFKLMLGGAFTAMMFALAGVLFYKANKEQKESEEFINQTIQLSLQWKDICDRYGK